MSSSAVSVCLRTFSRFFHLVDAGKHRVPRIGWASRVATVLALTLTPGTALSTTAPSPARDSASPLSVTEADANAAGFLVAAITAATPVITTVLPSTAIVGSVLMVTGTGFTGATAVTLNGVAVTAFTVVNDTTLTAVVPSSAASGPLVVTTPAGASNATVTVTIATPTPTANDRFDPNADGDVLAAVVQPDGKIIISGNFTTLQPFGSAAAIPRAKIARLNRDGTVDPSFLAGASLNAAASVIALEPDGKILLAGAFTTVNAVARNRLARLLSDGSLDSSFDPKANGAVTSLVRQPDGKLLIGGEFTGLQPNGAASSTPRSYLARLNSDGSLDSAFNIVFDSTGGTRVDTLALQPDGAVLVGGRFSTVSGSGRINFARFSAAGVLDAAFVPTVSGSINRIVALLGGRILVVGAFTAVTGLPRGNLAMLSSTGAVETFNPTANGTVTDAVVQADGKIVVAGEFTLVAGGTHNRIARLLPDGTHDASFTTDVNNTVRLLALQPDGSLLVAGDFTTLGGHGRSRIARLLPDGSVERALLADAGTGVVGALAVQPDGKIFVGGHFTTLAGQTRNFVARLNGDSTLDSFNPSPDASVIAPIPLPGGKFLLGGRFSTIAGQARTGLARFNADSTFDGTFNAGIAGGTLHSALLQSDGKIVIGGTFTSVGGQTRHRLARLNADGTLDLAFNPDVNGEVYGLALQGDGAIVFTGGFTQVGSTTRNRVARVSSAGVLDATFDPNANDLVHLATVQADGKIILAGAFTTLAGQARAGYARVTAAGTLDLSFNPASTAGGVTVVQADGKIVVGGVFNAIAGASRSYVARLNADGTIDSSFDVFSNGHVGALAIQPDGKLIVGGDFSAIGGQTRQRLARLHSTGPTATVLTATTSTLTLTRTGPLPELAWVTFEKSSDGATGWTSLGTATRVGTTANWQLTGQSLPPNTTCYLRASAASPTGVYGASSLVEQVQQVYLASAAPVAEPVFVTPPAPYASANVGASLTLTVSATAATGVTYQWRKHGQPLSGATGASLTLSNLTLFDSGLYDVVVTTSGVGFPSTASRVVVQAPVPSANLLTSSSTFAPRFESHSASFSLVHRAADGKVYVAGNFTSLFGALRPGFARLQADGSLDPSFAPAPVSHSSSTARLHSVAVQSDGRVLVGGQFDTVGGFPRAGLARLNADGSLDASFVPPANLIYSGRIHALLVQSDGKILAAGSFYESGINLVRLLPDGSRDATFVVGEGFDSTVYALALQGDGKLIAGGDFTRYNKIDVGRLVRLTATGALDTAYATAGGSAFDGRVRSLVLQPDGKLLVGGDFLSYNGTDRKRLARLLDTGALDPSFATGTGFNDHVSHVALQADGTILIAGDFQTFADVTSSGLVRLTSSGGRDATFVTSSNLDASAGFNDGTDGVAVLTAGVLVLSNDSTRYASPTANVGPLTRLTALGALDPAYAPAPLAAGSVNAVAPAPDGRWFVGGSFTHVNGVARPNLARLLPDGALDPDFVPAGTGLSSSVDALAVQPDGRVLVGGHFTQFDSTTANRLVRLTTVGALDATFATGSGFNGPVAALALQADGKVVVGGSFTSYNGTARNQLVRLSSAGALDSSFAQTGAGLGLSGSVNALALLADGRLYAGGEFTAYNAVTRYRLARFLADGTLDPAFVVGEATRFSSTVNALIVQPDGKLLVAGPFYSVGDFSTNGLTRLNDNGIRDTTFGAFLANGTVTALHLQADGRVIIGGEFTQHGDNDNPSPLPHLARLSPTGVVELAFAAPGFAATPRLIQSTATGALLVAGDALVFPGGTSPGLARLDAAPIPTISTQPVTQIASVGGTATFNVTAAGANLTYQWRRDGLAMAGANGPSYTISGAQLLDAASSYSVTVTNAFGSITSGSALLTGSGSAPTIAGYPASTTVAAGTTATLTVNAPGATHYQWRKLGVPVLGATAATLSLPAVTLGAAGLYDVLVGNGLSILRSPVARLTITPSATIQNPLTADRSFGAVFESANGAGFPSHIFAQPDGSYYVAGSESFSSIDGEFRFGLARFNAAGVLDSTFTPEISGGSIHALARQSDGKLVLVGDFHRVNGIECNHLARLHANGSLDTTFTHGYGTGTYDSLFAVAVQSDGKILLGGDLTYYGSEISGNRLARLNANGSVDTAFRTALGDGFNATVRGLALHSDGRIYVVGDFTLFNGSNTADHLVALNPDGTRFALPGLGFQTFGADRSALLTADASLSRASTVGNGTTVSSILVLADGKMIVGGYFYTFGETIVRHLVGLNADGSRDSGFSAGGGANNSITQLLRQSDGRLYATGYFDHFDSRPAHVVRLTATGAFESGYSFDGTPAGIALGAGNDLLVAGDFQTVYDFKSETSTARSCFARFDATGVLTASQITRWGSLEGYVETIVPAPGGKWLVGGYFARVGGRLINNLARIHADGTADTTFSSAQSPLYNTVRAIAVQGDGKILVGGGFAHYGTDNSYQSVGRLLRLNADGTRDLGFNLSSGFDGTVYAIVVQADGRILVGGEFSALNGKTVSHGLVRLLSDGSFDSTFQAGTGFLGSVSALAVQNDDKIIVGGNFSAYNSPTSNATRLVRLHANGVLETAFALSGDTVSTILLQPNGDILIGGTFTSVAGQPRTGVARFTSAGAFDATFNSSGLFDLGEGYASVRALALQADGKLIVGGDFPAPGDSSGTQQLLRLTAVGALDLTFAPNTYASPRAVALRADGGVLLAGNNLDVDSTYRYGLIAIAGAPPSSLPTITAPPVAQSAVYGGTATFSVAATGTPAPTYQWQRNGENISGATQATYTVTSASQANAGLYRVIVTNLAGSVPSAAVPFDVVTRNLINFYARAIVAPRGTIASSFTIEGTQTKTVLLVGVGGSRAATATTGGSGGENPEATFGGLAGTAPAGLADPRLVLTNSVGTVLGSNDNWTATNATALSAASAQVAATPGLTPTGEGANDAALLVTLAPGTYHVTLDDATVGGGAALLQIYDADTDGRPRLVMATLRAHVASGAHVVTAGFTVDGALAKTVLLRAIGSSLGPSPGVLEDPVITLYRGNTQIDRNDDTSFSEGQAPAAIAQVGARPYNDTLDSTLIASLVPGAYTVQVTPFSESASGTVLFELFEADAQRAATIAPTITYLTPNQTVLQNGYTSFGVVAVAKPAATYQWRKSGAAIEGATHAVLAVDAFEPGAAATYDVVITSGATAITSPSRTLTILPEFHSADSDRDHRIGLLELTRIIQFYNVRAGTTRTGAYHSLPGTEDGFTVGPGAITTYHSADSNRDGRLDVVELTRVIELYNYSVGTVRTGDHHAAVGTEDGFTPGPEEPDAFQRSRRKK